MSDYQIVRFSGLKELDRALGKADKDLRTILRDDLKEVAEIVAVEAQRIAREKGLIRSGDMIRKIQPFSLLKGTGVRSTSVHRGFRYPRRLEFEGRGGNAYGPDASLLPALDNKQAEVFAKAELLLDRLMVDLAS